MLQTRKADGCTAAVPGISFGSCQIWIRVRVHGRSQKLDLYDPLQLAVCHSRVNGTRRKLGAGKPDGFSVRESLLRGLLPWLANQKKEEQGPRSRTQSSPAVYSYSLRQTAGSITAQNQIAVSPGLLGRRFPNILNPDRNVRRESASLNLLRMTYAEPVLVRAMLQGASWSKSNFCWGMSLRSDYRTISRLQATDSVGCQRSPSNRTLTLRLLKALSE